ncbi:hypothetical protein LUZ63_007014 [Rhynchospora breviuscula]|uniref:Uncharacterized protein n=1 Tax=Rhynchospora breviuscula TaxID=2022672 RepID=A0A9Q0HU34_9POAL|nr:hypothetical protein LUZ63_007014 [Rhynchospora breviuscula]
MAAVVIGNLFGQVFEGCISGIDSEISKRPYHKYCSCAFHKKSSRQSGPSANTGCKKCQIACPIRPLNWRKRSLSVSASSFSEFRENLHEVERRKNAELLLQSFDLAQIEV